MKRPAFASTSASTLTLSFALLLLSCARPALCAPAEPVYTESYPAVAWQKVSKPEADSLDLLWYGEPRPKFKTIEEWAYMPSKWAQRMYWVHRAGHPLLDSLLPGTQFYDVAESYIGRVGGGPDHYTLALRDGKFYRLDRLNYLLRDAGFKFDTTEMADITKIAVLFTLLEKYPRTDSISLATAFPAVGFGEVALAEGKRPVPAVGPIGVTVACTVGGAAHVYGTVFQKAYFGYYVSTIYQDESRLEWFDFWKEGK